MHTICFKEAEKVYEISFWDLDKKGGLFLDNQYEKHLISGFVHNVVSYIVNGENKKEKDEYATPINNDLLTVKILKIITSREFNYQSTKQIQHNFQRITKVIYRHIVKNEPIPFFLDLGGGYHASTDNLYNIKVSYEVGMAEIFVLYQIRKFSDQIKKHYSKGIKFYIIIDNVVAHVVNGISIEKTLNYCDKFNEVLLLLNIDDVVNLIIESEQCNWLHNKEKIIYEPKKNITDDEYLNVVRFLGRKCTYEEAQDKIGKYYEVIKMSDSEINKIVCDEIRFVQRSESGQLTFRPFPGGASRIQSGIVGLRINNTGKIIPHFITSKNKHNFESIEISVDIIETLCEIKKLYNVLK